MILCMGRHVVPARQGAGGGGRGGQGRTPAQDSCSRGPGFSVLPRWQPQVPPGTYQPDASPCAAECSSLLRHWTSPPALPPAKLFPWWTSDFLTVKWGY